MNWVLFYDADWIESNFLLFMTDAKSIRSVYRAFWSLRPKMDIKMLVFATYFSMILNSVNAEETHSKCTGSFSECHALGLSTMEKFILTYELKWVFLSTYVKTPTPNHANNFYHLGIQWAIALTYSSKKNACRWFSTMIIFGANSKLSLDLGKIGFIKVFYNQMYRIIHFEYSNFTFAIASSLSCFRSLSKF